MPPWGDAAPPLDPLLEGAIQAPPPEHVREASAALPFALCQRVLAVHVPALVQAASMSPSWLAWDVSRALLVLGRAASLGLLALARGPPPAERPRAMPVARSGSLPPAGEADIVVGVRTSPGGDEEPPGSMGGPRPAGHMPTGAGGWGVGHGRARVMGRQCCSTLHCQWVT